MSHGMYITFRFGRVNRRLFIITTFSAAVYRSNRFGTRAVQAYTYMYGHNNNTKLRQTRNLVYRN